MTKKPLTIISVAPYSAIMKSMLHRYESRGYVEYIEWALNSLDRAFNMGVTMYYLKVPKIIENSAILQKRFIEDLNHAGYGLASRISSEGTAICKTGICGFSGSKIQMFY